MPNDSHPALAFIAAAASAPFEDAAFLRALLEAIPAAVVRLDPEQRIRYINRLRGGLKPEQVIGRPAREFIAAKDLSSWQVAIDRALQTGQPVSYTVQGAHPVDQGARAFYEGYAIPLDHGDGRRAVCIVAFDISEEMARTAAMHTSEVKLRIAVEATGIGIWTWDIDREVVEWDERLREIMGRDPIPPAQYVDEIVHPDDRARVRDAIASNRDGRTAFAAHRIIRPDGEVRWLLPCGQRMSRAEGQSGLMIGAFVDVTAERRLEAQLQRAQKLDALGSLTAGVAHNFNNMLAIIVPTLEHMLGKTAGKDKDLLQDAVHAAGRAAELVAQLMTFAGQRPPARRRPFELNALLERTLTMCRRTFVQQVVVDGEPAARPVEVSGDPAAIEQVVVNLLINARDAVVLAARVAPRIVVQLSVVETSDPASSKPLVQSYARIRVQDNGVGMKEQVKQRLFEPFFTTKEVGKGTGLGLATSYGIVREHGGFIAINSVQGEGTTFDVFLPRSDQTVAAERSQPGVAAATRHGTILVADDEPAIRRIVELVLCPRGHTVRCASDGESAIQALDAGFVPDVILLDRSMPGWPIQLVLDEIRKRCPRSKIVFFTGRDVSDGERAQVQDVLYKPLLSANLVESIERLLS